MYFMMWKLCLSMTQIKHFAMTDRKVLQTKKRIFYKSVWPQRLKVVLRKKCEVVQAFILERISQNEHMIVSVNTNIIVVH